MSARYHILVAPACFKGSLSASDVAALIGDFLKARLPDMVCVELCPIADGGDDTLSVLQASDAGFCWCQASVMGPLPEMTVQAQYLAHADKKQVVIEAAQAHGLKLLPYGALDPMRATSYGVGQLIRQALAREQPDTLIVSVGGSASTDGGMGLLQALGVRCFDVADQPITAPIGGGDLASIRRVEWPVHEWFAGRILIATDVVNPLLGPDGAAAVFAPQKGANLQQCQELETGLTHLAHLLSQTRGLDYSALPGVGAAGGLAYGLHHLPRSGLISGSQWVAEQLGLLSKIRQADLIITGEGRFDATSLGGKATGTLLVWAMGKPVFILCGQAQDQLDALEGVAVYPLVLSGESPDRAIAHPQETLVRRLQDLLPNLLAHLRP